MHRARATVRLELLVRIACVGWRASEMRERSGRERTAGGEEESRSRRVCPSGSGHTREPRRSGLGTTQKHEGTHETYRGRRAWSLGAFTSRAALSVRTPMQRSDLTREMRFQMFRHGALIRLWRPRGPRPKMAIVDRRRSASAGFAQRDVRRCGANPGETHEARAQEDRDEKACVSLLTTHHCWFASHAKHALRSTSVILSAAVHRSYRLNGKPIFRPSILSPSMS